MTLNRKKLAQICEALVAQEKLVEPQRKRQSTGFKELDKLTTGLADGVLMVIAARPAMGKTAFALDIARWLAANQETTTVFFSYELLAEQIAKWLLRKRRCGEISQAEAVRFSQSNLTQSRLRVYDDSFATVEDMQNICENTENLGAVIIDYFQLIHHPAYHTSEQNRFMTALGEISRSLKLMAKKLNVPVICISQLSKAVEYRTDKRPVHTDLHSALNQDADQILFLYRDRYYNPETPLGDIAECTVVKNRFGDVGTVKLQWNPEHLRFSDMEK